MLHQLCAPRTAIVGSMLHPGRPPSAAQPRGPTVLLTSGARPAQLNCCPAVEDTDLTNKWVKQRKGCSLLELSVRDDV